MTAEDLFNKAFDACPLIAILRGVSPNECEAIGDAVYEGGIRIIEVPLNSPQPFDSIKRLSKRYGDRVIVGAGTVLNSDQVEQVRLAGGNLIVSPSVNSAVITASISAGLVPCPGYFTPSEAFTAIDAGARVLKLFPAEAASPAVVRAQRAVLPPEIRLVIVGGVGPDSVAPWIAAGANGFGLGSALYKAGQTPAMTLDRARAFTAALRAQ